MIKKLTGYLFFLLLPTLLFSQNIQTVGEPADTLKQAHIRVDTTLHVYGNTILDGNLTMNTTAAESIKVLAGGIRNEGGFRQKGLSQFGATATPVYITADGKVGIGTATSSPYNAFGLVSSTSGRGTGIGLTSAQWNKKRTDWPTASDTSAIGMYIDSAGGPRFFMKGPPETTPDTLGLHMDGGAAYLKSSVGFNINAASITLGTPSVNVAELSLSGILPVASDSRSLGSATKLYQNGYFSDGLYLGGKGQTATQYISGENTIAGQDSSMKLWVDSGSPKLEMRFGATDASCSNGKLRTYFGPDTLAMFNGARTGRDSSWAVLVNGNVLNNGMVTIKRAVSLVDQAEYTPQIPSGMCGWGSVQIGDDVEWARFRFKTDGTVTLEANSTNVGTTNDTDTKLNIYDAGTAGIVIENQLGSTLTAAFVIECHLP